MTGTGRGPCGGRLRIVSWNCGGGLQRKWSYLAALQPDVAVIQEACIPERLGLTPAERATLGGVAWVGDRDHKGLAVVTFGEWTVQADPRVDRRLEWVLPVTVGGPVELTVVAVWAMNQRAGRPFPDGLPRWQAAAAADVYDFERDRGRLVVIGDFNSAVQWDTPRRPTFANLVERYTRAGLCSLYHRQTGERFGSESRPTHWWRDRRVDGPTYHIDYAFVSEALADAATIDVGGFEDWVRVAGSDHAPLVVDIDLAAFAAPPPSP